MPMTGPAESDPAKSASMYDHDLETATPYYYAAILEKHDIRVEIITAQTEQLFQFLETRSPIHRLLEIGSPPAVGASHAEGHDRVRRQMRESKCREHGNVPQRRNRAAGQKG